MVQATTRCVERYDGIDAVDLFCGGGGLTCGLRQAGVDVRMGVDFDGRCRYAYEHNNEAKFLHKSVTDGTAREMRAARHVPHRKISEADVKAFNAQHPTPAVRYTESFHDRFLVVDDREVYLICRKGEI